MIRRLLVLVALLASPFPAGALAQDVVLPVPVESALLRGDGADAQRAPTDPFRVTIRPTSDDATVTALTRDGHVLTIRSADRSAAPAVERERDPVLMIVGRLLVLAAFVVLAGGAAVARFVAGPGLRRPILADGRRLTADLTAPNIGGILARWGRGVALAALAGVVLTVAGLLGALGTGDLDTLLRETRAGHVALVAAAAAVAAALLLRRGVDPAGSRALGAASAAAIGLVAMSLGGHATSGTDAVLGGAFDAVHTLATAAWIGGLLTLLAARRAAIGDAGGPGALAAVVVRFSALAMTCVAALVVTGVYRALAELSGLDDLIDTPYGRVLLAKLVVFGILLGVGAYNRLVVHPRLERAALGLATGDRGAATALRHSVRVELSLAAALLALVAVMIGFAPPR